MNFYNEFEKFPAQWLRNLIDMGEIPKGVVDERSIKEIKKTDIEKYKQVHFFAGIGGWSYALRLAGWPEDLPVWTGSCPCQPFSTAGKRKGVEDSRHLWPEMFRLIKECRPPVVFGEQVASIDGYRWLPIVQNNLEEGQYKLFAANLSTASIGAPHQRNRLFWMAYAFGDNGSCRYKKCFTKITDGMGTDGLGKTSMFDYWGNPFNQSNKNQWAVCSDGKARQFEPRFFPLAYGLPRSLGEGSTREQRLDLLAAKRSRKGQLKGYGNAIVPQLAAIFIRAFMNSMEKME